MSDSFLKICIPKNGKPYLRKGCRPSDKDVDLIEMDPSFFNELTSKIDKLDQQLYELKSIASGYRRSRTSIQPYPAKIQSPYTPMFVGPDGNLHPIQEEEWDRLEKERVFGKPIKKPKTTSYIGPDGKRYNL